MPVKVKTILKKRLERLLNAELDEDTLNAFLDHSMAEHAVDQDNAEVIKATHAYWEFMNHRSSLEEECVAAFAKGRRDLAADFEKIDFAAVFDEIMRRHGVDLNDLEVARVLSALSEVERRTAELRVGHLQELMRVFKIYAAFAPQSPTPTK